MKQKHVGTGDQDYSKTDTSGDGVLKDLAAKAAALAPSLEIAGDGDARRRGEIKVEGSDDRYCLYIEGVLWAELDYEYHKKVWCIQDCMGHCLEHTDHVHAEVPGGENCDHSAQIAIKKAKEMIRDGSMPTPEQAK